jgi:hypothetical protein
MKPSSLFTWPWRPPWAVAVAVYIGVMGRPSTSAAAKSAWVRAGRPRIASVAATSAGVAGHPRACVTAIMVRKSWLSQLPKPGMRASSAPMNGSRSSPP